MSIHFIHAGLLPSESEDPTMLTTAIRQACQIYYAESCTLWVLTTSDPSILERLFHAELSAGRLKINPIDFLQILSSPKLKPCLERVISMTNPPSDGQKSLGADAISTIMVKINHMISTCQKISANNLLKELMLPLILAHQSLNGENAHFFDLSIFFDEVNDFHFNPTSISQIHMTELNAFNLKDNPMKEERMKGKLPHWDTIKIPIKNQDELRQWVQMKAPQISEPSELRYIPLMLSMDVWWMYTPSNPAAAVFYTSVFLRMLNAFLTRFPNISEFISTPTQTPKSLKKLQRYIEGLKICTFKRDLYNTDNTKKSRANYLAEIFLEAYAVSFELYVKDPSIAHRDILSVFTLCYNARDFSLSAIEHLLARITATVGPQSAFFNRFRRTAAYHTWSSREVGYYKSVGGAWHTPTELQASEEEYAIIRTYITQNS